MPKHCLLSITSNAFSQTFVAPQKNRTNERVNERPNERTNKRTNERWKVKTKMKKEEEESRLVHENTSVDVHLRFRSEKLGSFRQTSTQANAAISFAWLSRNRWGCKLKMTLQKRKERSKAKSVNKRWKSIFIFFFSYAFSGQLKSQNSNDFFLNFLFEFSFWILWFYLVMSAARR